MELLTVIEAAELTRMSPAWWRQRVFRKEIRFLKVGRRVLIPRSTVDELLTRSIVEPKKRHDGGADLGEPRK
jgi:excisionase family DNA binding protein